MVRVEGYRGEGKIGDIGNRGSTTEIGPNGGLGHLLSGTPNITSRPLYIPFGRRMGYIYLSIRDVVYILFGLGLTALGREGPGRTPLPLPATGLRTRGRTRPPTLPIPARPGATGRPPTPTLPPSPGVPVPVPLPPGPGVPVPVRFLSILFYFNRSIKI